MGQLNLSFKHASNHSYLPIIAKYNTNINININKNNTNTTTTTTTTNNNIGWSLWQRK
jgi:predicted AAA+ superfamily ATPase